MQHECKITVLETKVFPDLQEKYLANPKSGACPCFKVGDTFLLKRTAEQDDFYHLMNGRFCGEAWGERVPVARKLRTDRAGRREPISRYVYTALQGGSIMHKWTNDERVMIACCNDGTRPVIFKIERIDIPEIEREKQWLEMQNFSPFLDILCREKEDLFLPLRSLKSTHLHIRVVQFQGWPPYNRIIKFKEAIQMDTDKIYAEAIANEYSVKATPQVVALKKLDRKAKMPAQIFAYTFGIVAALVLGVGMCLSMGVIGTGMSYAFQLGVVLGVIGIAAVTVNYLLYKRILKNGKDKYAADIIRLAGEINAG